MNARYTLIKKFFSTMLKENSCMYAEKTMYKLGNGMTKKLFIYLKGKFL